MKLLYTKICYPPYTHIKTNRSNKVKTSRSLPEPGGCFSSYLMRSCCCHLGDVCDVQTNTFTAAVIVRRKHCTICCDSHAVTTFTRSCCLVFTWLSFMRRCDPDFWGTWTAASPTLFHLLVKPASSCVCLCVGWRFPLSPTRRDWWLSSAGTSWTLTGSSASHTHTHFNGRTQMPPTNGWIWQKNENVDDFVSVTRDKCIFRCVHRFAADTRHRGCLRTVTQPGSLRLARSCRHCIITMVGLSRRKRREHFTQSRCWKCSVNV